MTHATLLQPAFVLHTRPYRDTSLLLEIFTPDYGRVSTLARGARGLRSRFKGLLQPFVPLLLSWYGKTELMTLSAAESQGKVLDLTGEKLLCGLYLNELLMRLLHRYDAHPQLYIVYQETLYALQDQPLQQVLRRFEKSLLLELGYALQLNREAGTDTLIAPEQFYYFDPSRGVSACLNNELPATARNVFSGQSLLALHADELNEENSLRDAKRLLRIALGKLLEEKPIKSRELFI